MTEGCLEIRKSVFGSNQVVRKNIREIKNKECSRLFLDRHLYGSYVVSTCHLTGFGNMGWALHMNQFFDELG